jgi:hypothetical protein
MSWQNKPNFANDFNHPASRDTTSLPLRHNQFVAEIQVTENNNLSWARGYINSWSIWLDLRILLQTIAVEGGYVPR